MLILGIESSCDETSVAVVKDGREVLSNVINSQIKIHETYGGVVPEIASRCHIEAISGVTKEALKQAGITINDIDVISCTYGPGLVGALLVGVSYAKGLSYATRKATCSNKSLRRTHCGKLYFTPRARTTIHVLSNFRRTYSSSTYQRLYSFRNTRKNKR